jgi:hypothetical protein
MPTFTERYNPPPAQHSPQQTTAGSKFLRYTNEGYVEPNTEEKEIKKKQETLKWR